MTETSTYTHAELSARLAEAERERDELAAMAGRLRETLGAVRDDLLERGEIGSDGARVVGVGRGIWCQLHDALEETPPTALAEIRAEAVEAHKRHLINQYGTEGCFLVDLHEFDEYAQQLRNGGE